MFFKHLYKIPDEPGTFIGLPFTFEEGQRTSLSEHIISVEILDFLL